MRLFPTRFTAVAFLLMLTVIVLGADKPAEELAFDLEEVSGFGIGYCQRCICEATPDPNVEYPKFISQKPLYGLVRVDSELGDHSSGDFYYFAIDESDPNSGYDRLYLDADKNRDLTNEKPISPLENTPKEALIKSDNLTQQVCFDYVTFSSKDDNGAIHKTEFLPRLTISNSQYAVLGFIATKAYRGQFKIAGHHFNAVIKHNYLTGTRLDKPHTLLELTSLDDSAWRPMWLPFSEMLMAMHKIDGKYWCFSTTPSGDKIFVKPYSGDYGILKVGSGSRFIWTKKFSGSLFSKDKAVSIGYSSNNDSPKPVNSIRLPVGDYAPAMLDIHLGPLIIFISDNYHSDGKPRERDKPLNNSLKIRKNKTFVLDFSNEPDVLFASPARDTRLKTGEDLSVQAVLIDPKLDIMIRGIQIKLLEDDFVLTPRIATMFGAAVVLPLIFWLLSGKKRTRYRSLPVLSVVALVAWIGSAFALGTLNKRINRGGDKYDSLTPKVTICRADGEVVAQGSMPFG